VNLSIVQAPSEKTRNVNNTSTIGLQDVSINFEPTPSVTPVISREGAKREDNSPERGSPRVDGKAPADTFTSDSKSAQVVSAAKQKPA